ncbi:YKL065W-A [Saccharomyces arboricola H-6]|uniref:YKL065W-A n=1 Tax=Saccharomyces arboricola (strain H-6 / AS 2.3317 / CBS 10644) TaxID=1160507 RepID=J8Q5J3_SACAR|nr:YKL065W-A [Saccharomyces arboricola H-6]
MNSNILRILQQTGRRFVSSRDFEPVIGSNPKKQTSRLVVGSVGVMIPVLIYLFYKNDSKHSEIKKIYQNEKKI